MTDRAKKRLRAWRGDITTLEVDAIVNAANISLMGDGGMLVAFDATTHDLYTQLIASTTRREVSG